MANRRLRRMLMVGAFLFLPMIGLSAVSTDFTWGSECGLLGEQSGPNNTYGHSHSFLTDASLTSGQASVNDFGGGLYMVTGDTLCLDGTISVSGDVVISTTGSMDETVCVTVGCALMQNPGIPQDRGYVLVRPDNKLSTTDIEPIESCWAHLAFVTRADQKVEVKCDCFSLAFTGHWNRGNAIDQDQFPWGLGNGRTDLPLHISFWGQGQVNFRLKDGCCVVFRNHINDGTDAQCTNPAGILEEDCGCLPGTGEPYYGPAETASGVRVFVVMDQSEERHDNGECKLVFSRWGFEPLDGQGGRELNPKEGQTADVWVGRHSWITYLSENGSGLVGDGTSGFGSMGFDPSAQGTSRLVLRLLGGEGDDWTDAGLVVCGHRMPDPAGTISDPLSGTTLDARAAARFFELRHMAGVTASFKICDEVAYAADSDYFDAYDVTRRGLLVVNSNRTVPLFASNPYSTDRENPTTGGIDGNSFFVRSDNGVPANSNRPQIRNGFVLGVNAEMKIYHNCFLDYVASSTPRWVLDNELGIVDQTNGEFIHLTKRHNPAALFVDGLTNGRVDGTGVLHADPFGPGNAVDFTAFENGAHAKVVLCGDACMYLRSCAGVADKDADGEVLSVFCDDEPYRDANQDCVFSFTIGKGPYAVATDPNCPTYSVAALNEGQAGLQDFGDAVLGEGHHVLDVEGRLTVCSVDDDFVQPGNPGPCVRHDGTSATRSGKINLPPLRIDHGAQEIDCDGEVVVRPLDPTGALLYPRYQSSGMYFNSPVDYPNFGAPSATFFDTNLVHNDVTKAFAIPDPRIGEPGITGGSRAAFDDFNGIMAELPVLRMLNSTIHLHETLISTGVRFEVVEEDESPTGDAQLDSDADNTTSIISYHHGDILDARTGKGRVFMLGTRQNLMADGFPYQSPLGRSSFDVVYGHPFPLTSAFVNVYRRTLTPAEEVPTEVISLSLQTAGQFPEDLDEDQQAKQIGKHLFFMANKSQVALGWTGEFGDRLFHPWWNDLAGSAAMNQFTIAGLDVDSNDIQPASMSIDGNFYWIGGIDGEGPLVHDMFYQIQPTGNRVVKPVVTAFDPRAVFVNHGGELKASPDIDSVWDTTIARRLSTDDVLSGQIDIPMDQIRFTKGHAVQPYALDFTNGSLHLDIFNDNHTAPPLIDQKSAGGEEQVISWLYRTDSPDFLAAKSLGKGSLSPRTSIKEQILREAAKARGEEDELDQRAATTRTTPELTDPVSLPTNLLFATTGDYIRQLRVMGATCADPFHLHVTGDEDGFAHIREFATQDMDRRCELVYPTYGDGDYAALFLDGGARIGLGSRNWNEHSTRAWSNLGWDHVTLFLNGNSVVDVNSDLLIVDRLALIATDNFGEDTESDHRIEFFSDDNRVVRIPAGHELDLCTFGRQTSGRAFAQQVAFGGNVRLVFEAGSILRFPDGSVVSEGNAGAIILMDDDSRLIFQGVNDRDEGRFTDATGFDAQRVKIMGKGQFFLNKNATMEILDTAAVSVEADFKTPNTDITISIQRQAQMEIGNDNVAGGQFHVGNIIDVEGTEINFTLRLNGPRSRFIIEREGFFGLGVALVNKADNPNGAATLAGNPIRDAGGAVIPDPITGLPQFTPDDATAWRYQRAYNVNNVEIRLIRGIFDHSNIFDGSDANAQGSLMAVGPVAGTYTMRLGTTDEAIVRGGGNVMFVRDATNPTSVNIWSFADPLLGPVEDEGMDTGKYSILASTDILRQRVVGTAAQAATDSSRLVPFGGATVINSGVAIEGTAIGDSREFIGDTGNSDDFYNYIAFPNYALMLPTKFVDVGSTQFNDVVGFVNDGVDDGTGVGLKRQDGTNIVRVEDVPVINTDGTVANAQDGVPEGVLSGSGDTDELGPEKLVVIKR